ncbi:MAG: cytochrome P450 [Acidimicrobiia bacterium]
MVGAPLVWADSLFDLSERLLKVFTGDSAFSDSITEAAAELASRVFELIEIKQHQAGDDLTSMMLARLDGESFTISDVATLLFEMLAASTDNTAHSIGITTHLLASHADQYDLLRTTPGLAQAAFDEAGRVEPRVRSNPRYAIAPTNVLGVDIPIDTFATLSIVEANRDPSVFPHPDRFDITCEPAQPHLGFGVGRHHCLGAALARMEATAVLDAMAKRWRSVEVHGEPVIQRSNDTAIAYLPIAVT